MPVRNDSGHDVEIDVEEGEPPPGPGVVGVPGNALFASTALTLTGGALAVVGCLFDGSSLLLTMLGVGALGIAIGIQGYLLAAGRRQAAPKRLVYGGDGPKLKLKPGETVDYTFKPGDCVVFCWKVTKGEVESLESLTSAPVLNPGALVELIEVPTLGLGHAVVIHP